MSLERDDNIECLIDEPVNEDGPLRMQIQIKRRRSNQRIDKYLQGRFPRFSRTALQKLIKEGAVTVNEKVVKPSYDICPNDLIEVILPIPESTELVAEPIPLDIIYEDDHMLAVNKQAGLVVHPARGYTSGTLVNGLAWHCQQLSHGDDTMRPGIVHRLDKDTTGVMVVAKSDEAHWRLALQFERRRTHKEYLAVVEGEVHLDADRIDAPIGPHRHIRERYAVRPDTGKASITDYHVVERFRGFTLVRLVIHTGRTHQIRVHMSHIRHPVVGDDMYGARNLTVADIGGPGDDTSPIITRQALHAELLQVRHPISGEQVDLRARPADDIQRLLELLRTYRAID